MRLPFIAVAMAVALSAESTGAQTAKYHHQTFLPAGHNWAFAREFPAVDGLFNGFDYGHSILYETLWTKPSAPATALDIKEFDFITKKLLLDPPSVPLDETAIGPEWTRLVPEVLAMFEWAHMLHRHVYDIMADGRIPAGERDERVAEVLAYYKSRPALALSSHPKDMDLMEGQPYSLAFRKRFPMFNGLVWSYHWLQMTIYDALMEAADDRQQASNIEAVASRFREMFRGGQETLPTVMPMSAAIAPTFSAAYPEVAIIFDNLHSLHDVVSDILANPSVPRGRKRTTLLEAAARYRDSTSSITTVDEWRSMAMSMGLAGMGGAAPIGDRRTPSGDNPAHKH